MTDRELMQDALDALESSRVCVTSREKIKHPEGTEWYDERIEALRDRLAQPKQEPVVKLKELLEVQGRDGTWNYDPYFHGMYNGMEVMLAVLENREPVFRGAPKKWLSKKEWQGLTDEEVKILATQGRTDFSRPMYSEFYSAIEAKLKEKNT